MSIFPPLASNSLSLSGGDRPSELSILGEYLEHFRDPDIEFKRSEVTCSHSSTVITLSHLAVIFSLA